MPAMSLTGSGVAVVSTGTVSEGIAATVGDSDTGDIVTPECRGKVEGAENCPTVLLDDSLTSVRNGGNISSKKDTTIALIVAIILRRTFRSLSRWITIL
jgi:hypothetical protein